MKSRIVGSHTYSHLALILPIIVLLGLFIVTPLTNLALLAWAQGEMFSNIARLFADTFFWISIRITLTFVVVSVGTSVVLGTALALILRDVESPILRAAFLLPMLVAPISVGLVWRLLYHPSFGVFNAILMGIGLNPQGWLGDPHMALPSVIIVDIWQWTPFIFLVILSGLKALPHTTLEAGRIDGASRWQLLVYITLPQLKPTIFVAVLFRTLDAIKAFDKIVTLTAGGPGRATDLVAMHIYRVSFSFFQFNYAALLAMVPIVFLFLFERSFTYLLRRSEE